MKDVLVYITKPYNAYAAVVTSNDLIKAFALWIMIVDHIGLYFYPEQIIYRVIGRTGLPVWFFLIGYHFKDIYKLPKKLFIPAAIIEFQKIFLVKFFFKLNALVSMIINSYVVGLYQKYLVAIYSKLNFIEQILWLILSSIFCILFYPITNNWFEYGVLGMFMAIYGYNIRYNIGNKLLQTISVLSLLIITQDLNFNFNNLQIIICALLMCITMIWLYNFKIVTYNIQNYFLKYFINISGRYTMEIYVLHIMIFRSFAN